jgi:hypothetical protein
MRIRKRNDADGYRRGAMGIDGNKGASFLDNSQDPWTQQSVHEERSYSRNTGKSGDKFTELDSQDLLRNKSEFSDRAPTRSIANLVLDDAGEVNSGYSGRLPNVDMDN